MSQQLLGGTLLLLAQDALDLLVDHARRLFAVVARVHEVLTQEDHALRAPGHRTDAVAHTELAHHALGHLGAALQVVARAGGERAEHDLLRAASAHAHAQRVLDVLERIGVALLHRQLLRHAEGHARGQDRHLVHRV